MPGKHPAPHDQVPLHYAVSQELGMVFVSYRGVDEQAVMVKLHHASTCMQPRLDSFSASAHVGRRR